MKELIDYFATQPFALAIVGVLLFMSLLSWYIIIKKYFIFSWLLWRHARLQKRFATTSALKDWFESIKRYQHPSANIAKQMIFTFLHYRHLEKSQKIPINQKVMDFLEAAREHALLKEREALQSGLTVLASIGAMAPFVGLLGTVMSIYFALMKIAQTGQATLAIVAQPIGEALILTALGLAVALPAVLFYNLLLRSQKQFFLKLQLFSHQVLVYLITGQKIVTP